MNSISFRNEIYTVRPKSSTAVKHVYFVRHLDTKAIKIGCSQNPKQRIIALRREFGGRMGLMGFCSEPSGMAETTFHHYLESWALGREWFAGDPEIVSVARASINEGLSAGLDLAKYLHESKISA